MLDWFLMHKYSVDQMQEKCAWCALHRTCKNEQMHSAHAFHFANKPSVQRKPKITAKLEVGEIYHNPFVRNPSFACWITGKPLHCLWSNINPKVLRAISMCFGFN